MTARMIWSVIVGSAALLLMMTMRVTMRMTMRMMWMMMRKTRTMMRTTKTTSNQQPTIISEILTISA